MVRPFARLFLLHDVVLSELVDVVSAQESHVVFWLFVDLAQLQVVLAVVVAFLVPVEFADFLFWPVVFFGVVLLLLLKLGIKSSRWDSS